MQSSEEQNLLIESLQNLGVGNGDSLIVLSAFETDTLDEMALFYATLQAAVGSEGTLLFPHFSQQYHHTASTNLATPNSFSNWLLSQPNSLMSNHPLFPFVSVGNLAEYLTANVPFHYPLGTDSPLARLYQRNGKALLYGVGQEVNCLLHLAEVWANVPYVHRHFDMTTIDESGEEAISKMRGYPGCTKGFAQIEPIFRQARLLRWSEWEARKLCLFQVQQVVSMAVSTLQGSADFLLCNDLHCSICPSAKKLASKQVLTPSNFTEFDCTF